MDKRKLFVSGINIFMYFVNMIVIYCIYNYYGRFYCKDFISIMIVISVIGVINIFSRKNKSEKQNKYSCIIAFLCLIGSITFIFLIDRHSPVIYILLCISVLFLLDSFFKLKILNEENIFVFIMIIVIFVGAFIFPKVNNMYTVNRVEKTIKEQGYENVQYISILNNTAIKIFFDEEIHFGAYCFRAHKGDKEYDIIVNVEGGKIIDYSEDGSNDFMNLLIEGEG